jgi:hypothetical protein
MSREHYAWGSLRRTSRQVGFAAAVIGLGFVVIVQSLMIFGGGE